MKLFITLTLITIGAISISAQAKTITAADYDGAFQYAVSETNAAFPFKFIVITQRFENGKLVSNETEVTERQAAGVERETKTLEKSGQTLRSYSVMVGFDNGTYCSSDGVNWKGPQEFVCPGPDGSETVSLSRPRKPESVQYSATEESRNGKPVKVYRKLAIFPATAPNGKKSHSGETVTLDSRGFFISVVYAEGILDSKPDTTLYRRQTWDLETKFKPVVTPK